MMGTAATTNTTKVNTIRGFMIFLTMIHCLMDSAKMTTEGLMLMPPITSSAPTRDKKKKPMTRPVPTITSLKDSYSSSRSTSSLHSMSTSTRSSSTDTDIFPSASQLSGRIDINEDFPNLQKIYDDPDIYVIRDFLQPNFCDDLIDQALKSGKLQQSPVAYAGWTEDFKDLVELAAKGPVAWIALVGAWWQLHDSSGVSQVDLVLTALRNYAVVFVIATSLIAAFTVSRAQALQAGRTSTSTTLNQIIDGDIDPEKRQTDGTTHFVEQASKLFFADGGDKEVSNHDVGANTKDKLRQVASYFEAPTIIRYEKEQKLAPHYDANRSASTEDINRGGQTLATLLVYLNDVEEGGLTRFGKLDKRLSTLSKEEESGNDNDNTETKLIVQPQRGDALLFFPADKNGVFDPRLEHEGMDAIAEKWISRIWFHQYRVPPPFGISDDSLNNL